MSPSLWRILLPELFVFVEPTHITMQLEVVWISNKENFEGFAILAGVSLIRGLEPPQPHTGLTIANDQNHSKKFLCEVLNYCHNFSLTIVFRSSYLKTVSNTCIIYLKLVNGYFISLDNYICLQSLQVSMTTHVWIFHLEKRRYWDFIMI